MRALCGQVELRGVLEGIRYGSERERHIRFAIYLDGVRPEVWAIGGFVCLRLFLVLVLLLDGNGKSLGSVYQFSRSIP
jgi:hypothetical protein